MNSTETTPGASSEDLASQQEDPVIPTIKGSSSDFSPNSQSSPGSPNLGPTYIGRPVCNDLIDVPVFQLKDKTVFVLITFPTTSLVTAVVGLTTNRQNLSPEYRIASPYGDSGGFNFDQTTRFVPGDYCFALVFKSPEEARNVSLVRLLLQSEPVSNLAVAQMLFGLYRALGFEPSHVMKYPTRSVNTGNPFYRKIRNEISKLTTRISAIETPPDFSVMESRLNELSNQLDDLKSLLMNLKDQQIEDKLKDLKESTSLVAAYIEKVKDQPIVTVEQIEDKLKDLKESTSLVAAYVEKVKDQPIVTVEQIEDKLKDLKESTSLVAAYVEKVKDQPIVTVEQIEDKLKDLKESTSLVAAYVERAESDPIGNRQEKGSSEIVSIEMIENLIHEKEVYLNKLREAEDYIDHLTAEEEKKSTRQGQWFQPTWDKKAFRR